MGTALQDLRVALRMLRKSPTFTVAAVVTLAFAIGANAVVFGAFNALVLRPLNVRHAETLYELGRTNGTNESYPSYLDLRDRNHSFDGLAANSFSQAGLDAGEGPVRVWGFNVTGNYFDVLGVQPYIGRLLHASDEHGPNSAPYLVLSYAYWHTHFHDDRGVVGRKVRLDKHPYTIIGVAPPGFRGILVALSPDYFAPMVMVGQDLLKARGTRWLDDVMGHLKPGVTPAQAKADLDVVGSYLKKTYPEQETQATFDLGHPGMGDLFNGAIRAFLVGLMLLAGLILLAACANLGSLFTARAAERSREIALRIALGAGRLRVFRQLLTEALVIAFVGGAVGLWASTMLLQGLSAWQPFPEIPLNVPVSPDANVYLVAMLLAVASGFLSGIVPVRQVLRTDPYEIVKSGSRSTQDRRITVRDVLVAIQIAICAVLVTSSVVAVRGLIRSFHSNLGVEPRNAMLVRTDLSEAGYSEDKVPAMQQRMIDAMATIPGVTSAGLVGQDPPLHMGWYNVHVFKDNTSDFRPSNAASNPLEYKVSPGYFHAAGTTLLTGRMFTRHDDKTSPRVAIVNPEFAREMFGSAAQAMGRYYKTGDGTRIQVVGIVEQGKYTAYLAEKPQPAMFLPFLQTASNETWLVVRSPQDSQQLAAAIKNKLRTLDAGVPAFIETWHQEMSGALFAPRMATLSLGVLGMMGGLLSVIGILGMAAYSVSKRKKELGIRSALGAQHRELLEAALGRALKVLTFGSATGLVVGLLASRVLAAIVYQATPRDPLVMTTAVLAMGLLGLMATWIPAQQALAIDPMMLLRDE